MTTRGPISLASLEVIWCDLWLRVGEKMKGERGPKHKVHYYGLLVYRMG